MGEIFLAQGESGEFVAVKRMLPEVADDSRFVEMFLDEARLNAHLDHPNIPRVHHFGRTGGAPFLVMEWVHGATLRQLQHSVATEGALPMSLVVYVASRIADALDYAHNLRDGDGALLGIIHRDVSPPNIVVGFDGHVKLLDFGLAKSRSQLYQTQPGYVKGKFGYLAPEQVSEAPIDARADVFALGLCLYETLTGTRLFPHDSPTDALDALRGYTHPPSVRSKRPDVPGPLEDVMLRALAPRPAQRFPTAAAFRDALEAVIALEFDPVDPEALSDFVSKRFAEPASDPFAAASATPDHDQSGQEGLATLPPVDFTKVRKRSTRSRLALLAACTALLGAAYGLTVWLLS